MTDDELFRPLSARTNTRRTFSSSGREITSRHGDGGNVRKIRAAMARAQEDKARRGAVDD